MWKFAEKMQYVFYDLIFLSLEENVNVKKYVWFTHRSKHWIWMIEFNAIYVSFECPSKSAQFSFWIYSIYWKHTFTIHLVWNIVPIECALKTMNRIIPKMYYQQSYLNNELDLLVPNTNSLLNESFLRNRPIFYHQQCCGPFLTLLGISCVVINPRISCFPVIGCFPVIWVMLRPSRLQTCYITFKSKLSFPFPLFV